jgi:pyruvate,water dikinase
LQVLETSLAEKKIAFSRDSSGKTKIFKLNPEMSKAQVLKEHELRRLADLAIQLEIHYGKPQDIEFAIEKGEIFIVQTRPITTIEKRINSDNKGSITDKGAAILSGLPASPGVASGVVKIINDLKDLDKIKKGDILVTEMTNPDMVVSMQKSSAIITDEGGLTAHAAIVSREMGIPCVVGTRLATQILKDGNIVTVDGYNGKVYMGETQKTEKKDILPVSAVTKTKIKVIVDLPSFAERASQSGIKKVGLTRIEGIIAESGKHPNLFLNSGKMKDYEDIIFKGVNGIAKYFDELWVRTSDIRTDEYKNLEGAPKEVEANPMLGMHGIRFSLKYPDILKAELNALKRVAESGKTIGILMPQVILVGELQAVKKIIKEIGFEVVKVGIMIETPAAVQLIKEFCEEGIDFISFGTNDLTQYMLAIDRGNESVQHLYNEMHPAILRQIEYVIRTCKRYEVESSICGQSGSKKEMVKFLVDSGIDSISVNADVAKEISDYVAELEKGTDKDLRGYEKHKEKEQALEREVEEVKQMKSKKSEKEVVVKDVDEAVSLIEQEKKKYLAEHPDEKEDSSYEEEFLDILNDDK